MSLIEQLKERKRQMEVQGDMKKTALEDHRFIRGMMRKSSRLSHYPRYHHICRMR